MTISETGRAAKRVETETAGTSSHVYCKWCGASHTFRPLSILLTNSLESIASEVYFNLKNTDFSCTQKFTCKIQTDIHRFQHIVLNSGLGSKNYPCESAMRKTVPVGFAICVMQGV